MSAKKPSTPVPAPAPPRRPSPAMEAFERAMKVLGKRDFEKARQLDTRGEFAAQIQRLTTRR